MNEAVARYRSLLFEQIIECYDLDDQPLTEAVGAYATGHKFHGNQWVQTDHGFERPPMHGPSKLGARSPKVYDFWKKTLG